MPLKLRLIRNFHKTLAAGPPRRSKTLELLARHYYWPKMYKEVDQFVRNCHICKRAQNSRHAPFGVLCPMLIPDGMVAPVRQGFLLFFIFYYFYFISHFVVYVEVWSEGSIFFLGTIMQAEVMQETCQGPKEAVIREDGVNISITGRHHHRSSTDRPDRQERRTRKYKKAYTASKQARSLGRPRKHAVDRHLGSYGGLPPPILQPIRPARFLAFLIMFFSLFFLSFGFFCCLPFGLLLLIEIYVIFYVSLRTKRTLAHSCWR